MRYYRLSIDNDSVVIEQNRKNPAAPCVQFNIQTYNTSEAINAEITIYNLPLYVFGQYQKFYNKKIELRAGISSNPLNNRIGIEPPKEDLILSGYIAAVIPDWNGSDNQFTFICVSTPVYEQDAQGNINTEKPAGQYSFNIKTGDNPSNEIENAINVVTNKTALFTNRATAPLANSPCNTPVSNMAEIADVVKTYGLMLYPSGSGFILDEIGSSGKGREIQLKATDFLTQPSALNLAEMALTLFMRGDVRLGDTIILPEKTFVGITALTENGGRDNRVGVKQGIFTMFSGKHAVTKIWHVGDSQNADVQAWATHLQVVRIV